MLLTLDVSLTLRRPLCLSARSPEADDFPCDEARLRQLHTNPQQTTPPPNALAMTPAPTDRMTTCAPASSMRGSAGRAVSTTPDADVIGRCFELLGCDAPRYDWPEAEDDSTGETIVRADLTDLPISLHRAHTSAECFTDTTPLTALAELRDSTSRA